MDKMIGFYIFVFCCQLLSVPACDPGWFGSDCQYKCHCVTSCDGNGLCLPGSSCAIGWFGPLCQYQDLAQLGSTTTISLTDGEDNTCVSVQNFTISWSIRYEVIALRATFQTYDPVSDIRLAVKANNSDISFTPCTNQTISIVNEVTTDIYCSYNTTVQVVTINFGKLRSVCTVNVNGGRNIALNQPTWQSGDYVYEGIPWASSRAVDGNTDRNALKNSCSGTLLGLPGTWKVTFPQPVNVNRYIVYNRDAYKTFLSNFTLISYSSSNKSLLNYTDPNTVIDVCIVTSLSTPSVSYVQIHVKDALILCEVEVFEGCAIGWFGPSCQNKCHCTNTYCDVSGGCYGGSSCDSGWFGPLCQYPCDGHHYGPNCLLNCSSTCEKSKCNITNGECLTCVAGFQGRFCNTSCDSQHFGPNCIYNCSPNCERSQCNKTTGECFTCVAGFKGTYCSMSCDSQHFGPNCVYTCSPICENSECNETTGYCNRCKAGYQGDFCDSTCDNGRYGAGCTSNCSHLCVRNETQAWCNKTDGQCLLGCVPGFTQGDTGCSRFWACPIGYYGDNCQYTESGNHKAQDRLAEGIGIGIGIMCVVNVIIVIIVCIFVKTMRSVTSKTNNGNKINKEGETQDNNVSIQPDYTDLNSASAVADTNHYDYINGNMGPYDTLNNDFKETSQYEAVSMATLKNRT